MTHPLLYIYWDPSITLFGTLRWYSVCWLVGLLLAYLIVRQLYKQQKIKDDILGCIDFWPRFASEEYFYGKIEWYDLQNMLKEGHYTIKPELQKQFDTFDYGTNELIIRCKKKKM